MENRDCMKSHVELSKPDLNCANNQSQNHKKFQCSTPNISEVMVDLRFPIVIHKGKSCLYFTAEIDMGWYDTERGLDGDGFPCLVLGYGPTHSQRRPPERATTMCHRAPNSCCSLVFSLSIYIYERTGLCLPMVNGDSDRKAPAARQKPRISGSNSNGIGTTSYALGFMLLKGIDSVTQHQWARPLGLSP